MARSEATTVKQYLEGLPAEQRAVVSAVRTVIRRHLPAGYREGMGWGMIVYSVPLKRYPDTYNGQPLCFAALAAQKHYCALYLMGIYQDPVQRGQLERSVSRAGKKLDMGKSCVRFRRVEDLPLEDIGALVASTPVETFVAREKAMRARTKRR
jgi:hypothetical protein